METKLIFEGFGFYEGRMISGSKSGYMKENKSHHVLFNANIFSKKKRKKIWYGDLDITRDCKKLQKIADISNDTLYIVREMYGRFGAEDRKFKEIIKDSSVYFKPNSDVYYNKILSDEVEIKKIAGTNIIGNKGLKWEEKEI